MGIIVETITIHHGRKGLLKAAVRAFTFRTLLYQVKKYFKFIKLTIYAYFKGLVPGKDSQVFVLTTLENPPIYIFLKWNNVSLKRRPDAFKYQSTFFL